MGFNSGFKGLMGVIALLQSFSCKG